MKRTLICLTAIALLGACKEKPATTTPDGTTTGDTGGTKPADGTPTGAPTVAQEPDPPAIAQAREQYMLGNYDKAKELLEPLTADLKTRQQLRASGLSAGWLALAVVDPVAENAKEPAEHAVAMGEQTGDKEVQVVGKLALGAYQMGTDDAAHAATSFEEAYKLQTDGPNAGLALVLYGQAKVNMAFGGEEKDQIAHPAELDSAASTFIKAQRLAADKPGNELIAARAYEGLASVANYKKSFKEACTHIQEAAKIYKTKSAGQPLIERVNAIMEAAACTKPA
jgi:tetratricopeptide (TPR) repeat protein